MKLFLESLKQRNELLFYFGVANLILAVIFIIFTRITGTQVMGANAWFKPFKFAASIGIYSLTMAWICGDLPASFNSRLFAWTIIFLLGIEIIYIAIQAGRGQLSHFNISNPFYSGMYAVMAISASGVAIYTAYIGVLFFTYEFSHLPDHYLWALRLGMVIFVIFSFEGFVMGSRLSHTIGGPDGGPGLPVTNWSYQYGDPRIAHFIGMHALQVLPLLAFYIIKDTKTIIAIGVLYFGLAVFTLIQAFQGKPFSSLNIFSE